MANADDFTPIGLGTKSNLGRFGGPDGGGRLINCYVEQVGDQGQVLWPIYPIDGQTDYATFDAGTVRAQIVLEDLNIMLTVCGSNLYQTTRVNGTNTQTTVGGILGDGLVTMARNRNALPMVAIVTGGANGEGGNWYVWQHNGTTTGTLTEPGDTDLPAPNSVAWFDGYFIFSTPGGRWYLSGIDDKTVASTDFASAEARPGGLQRVAATGRHIVLFGPKGIEFWEDTGATPFPFERTTTSDLGILAPGSVAALAETLFFVASDGTIRQLQGYSGVTISEPMQEQAIANETDPTAITGLSVDCRGHAFYILSGSNFTFAYDVTTKKWHERESHGLDYWRCSTYAKFDGDDIFGSITEAKLYKSHQTYYDESGHPLITTIQPPAIHSGSRFILDALLLKFVAGQGLNTPNAPATLTPQVMVTTSRDGGITFGPERQQSLGVQGERIKRAVFRNFGSFKDQGCIVRIACSAAVARGFLGLGAKVTKLAA